MAGLDGQAFMDQTNAILLEVRAELQTLRTEQDAATATVTNVTADVGTFRVELREQLRVLVMQQQQDLANMHGLLAGLNLPDLMATQGLIMDETIKTALAVTSTSTGGPREGSFRNSILESKTIAIALAHPLLHRLLRLPCAAWVSNVTDDGTVALFRLNEMCRWCRLTKSCARIGLSAALYGIRPLRWMQVDWEVWLLLLLFQRGAA